MSSRSNWPYERDNKGPKGSLERGRATLGPALPFALPELVLAVLAGRVVAASSGTARFPPASHTRLIQPLRGLARDKSVYQPFWWLKCPRGVVSSGGGCLRRQELAGVGNETSRVHDHVTFTCVNVMLSCSKDPKFVNKVRT